MKELLLEYSREAAMADLVFGLRLVKDGNEVRLVRIVLKDRHAIHTDEPVVLASYISKDGTLYQIGN